MLAVQTSRRVGQLERALDWVILWLKALGDNITAHMTEPVSLWVKTKIDAARNSEEDLRLRYGQILMLKVFCCCCCHVELLIYKCLDIGVEGKMNSCCPHPALEQDPT